MISGTMVARACVVGFALLALTPTVALAAPDDAGTSGAGKVGMPAQGRGTVTPPAPQPPPGPPPSAPILSPGDRTFVAFAGRPAPVALRWAPVPRAAGYRVRWGRGDHAIDHILPATSTAFEHAEHWPGQHHVEIFAVDEHGQEGPPTKLAVQIVDVEAVGLGRETHDDDDDDGADEDDDDDSRAFAVGSRFTSAGLRCRLGDGTPVLEAVATAAGPTILRCGGEPGQPSIEVPLIVVPVTVTANVAAVQRSAPTRIHITVASTAAVGDHLQVEAIGDVGLRSIVRAKGGLDVEVVAATTGAPEAVLVIGGGTVELGRVRFQIVDAPVPVAPSFRPAWFALDLGGHLGAFVPPQVGDGSLLLGEPLDPDDSLGSGPLAGVRIGLFPTRRVGVELEAAIATPSYVGRLGVATLLISRLQLAARVAEDGRYGLRTLLGADALSLLSTAGTSRTGTAGGLHYGAAFTVETRRGVSVRFQALHVITVARDAGYAHCLELGVGVITRLGRRDRWN